MVGLRHDALLYGSEEDFVSSLVPFVRDGVTTGEPVLAVLTKPHIDLLSARLGATATSVRFVDADEWYRRPIAALAEYRRSTEMHVAAGAERVRVIGEVPFGRSDPGDAEWTRYEAALNRALSDLPAWVVCPYDARLPEALLQDATRTHPMLAGTAGRRASSAYAPSEVVRSLRPEISVVDGVLLAVRMVHGKLLATRSTVRAMASEAGLDSAQVEDFVTAVNEIISNALIHGGGAARVALWQTSAGLVCEVSDTGTGVVDDFIGFGPAPDRSPGHGGLGVWMARQMCDALEFVPCAHGTTVRLRAAG
jgi:anti-sigma regulatory factor (Ser/Thr protein kinase)